MEWQTDRRKPRGGYWRCVVKNRESTRRWFASLSGPAYSEWLLRSRRSSALYRRRNRRSRMARYRQKDETDLVWNRIRRRITRELDTQLSDWREEALNKLLSDAWTKYADSLNSGTVLELEAEYTTFVGQALNEHIDLKLETDEVG